MKDIQTFLISKFPSTEEKIEGRLAFLKNAEIFKLSYPRLEIITSLNFYKTKFLSGYKEIPLLTIVLGLSKENNVFLLTNPVFSSKDSNLTKVFEEIKSIEIDEELLSELVDIYRETGAVITEISSGKYQIWTGDNKWRILDFEINDKLKIKTTPNSPLPKAGRTWLQKLFGN